MVESYAIPAVCVVTSRALACVMSSWSCVTGLAVGEACVVKKGICPVAGVVAGRTLARVMVCGSGVSVTTGASDVTCVIECGILPIIAIVASGALARVMIFGGIFGVATGAIGKAGVVKNGRFPSIRLVACAAIACIMRLWGIVYMTACAIIYAHMVKRIRFPVGDEMARFTFAFKMLFWWLVTLAACGGGVGKCAIGVAGFAGNIMAAFEQEEAVVNILQEGDGGGIDAVCIAALHALLYAPEEAGGLGHSGVGVCAKQINGRFLQGVQGVIGRKRPSVGQKPHPARRRDE